MAQNPQKDSFEQDSFEPDAPTFNANEGSWLNRIFSPTVDIRKGVTPELPAALQMFGEEHPYVGGALGFGADLISSLSSPLNIATGGVGAGAQVASRAGFPLVAKGLDRIIRGLSTAMVGEGAAGMYNAETWPETVGAGVETIGGGLGVRYGAGLPRQRVPEVLSPEVLPPQKSLPLPRGSRPVVGRGKPFTGGTAGVKQGSTITPLEEARLMGQEFIIDSNGDIIPAGRPAPNTGTVMETGRREDPFFTMHEQQGGTALDTSRTIRLYRWESEPGAGVPDWLKSSPEYQASKAAEGGWWTDDPNTLEFYRQDARGKGRVIEMEVTPREANQFKVSNNPEALRFSKDPATEYFIPRGAKLEVPTTSERYLRGRELGFEQTSRAGQATGVAPEILGDTLEAKLARSRSHPPGTPDLPYPLNVVPESVRPRSEQAVQQSLAGTPKPMTEAEKFVFENEPPPVATPGTPPNVYAPEATNINPDILLPSAVRESRRARTNTRLNIDETTVSNAPEPLQAPLATLIEKESKLPSPWKAVYTTLEKLSPTLTTKSKRMVQRVRQYDAQWIPQLEAAISKMKKEDKVNFGAYVEGTTPITNPNVQAAVDIWKQIESVIGDKATQIGLRLYTDSKNWVPFIKNTNDYWPHIPTDKPGVGFIQKLMDSGLTRSQAKRVEAHWRKTGEIVIGPQHARQVKSNVPYRLDADAGLQHVRSMAKRIAQHEEMGPMDVRGRGAEGIADLIENTRDPNLANKLMERILERDPRSESRMTAWLDASRRFAAIAHLQNFTIPNMILGSATTAQRASRYPIASFGEVTKLLSKRYRGEMERSGVWQNLAHTVAEEMGKINTSRDWYGIGFGEKVNRGIAGAVGKAVAKQAHITLKRKPLDKWARRDLSELVLEDTDSLITQSELTPQQLDMAAGRMAEMTQGLNVPGNLPLWASDPVNSVASFGAQLTLVFKKMGYQATKNIWDTIDPHKVGITNSARNAAVWMGLSQVAGELVGVSKDLIKEAQTLGAYEPPERGARFLEGNGIPPAMLNAASEATGIAPGSLAHMLENASNAFFLGMPADMMMSAGYGPQGLLSAIAGPVFTDISKLGYYASQGNVRGLTRETAKMAPYIGSTQSAEMFTDYLSPED